MKKSAKQNIHLGMPLLDSIVIFASYFAVLSASPLIMISNETYEELGSILILLVVIGVSLMYSSELYSNLHSFTPKRFFYTCSSMMTLGLIASVYMMFRGHLEFALEVIVFAGASQMVMLSLIRILTALFLRRKMSRQSVLVVGTGIDASITAKKIILSDSKQYVVKYIVSIGRDGYSAIEGPDSLIDDVDVVMICSGVGCDDRFRMIAQCTMKKKKVLIMPELYEISIENLALNHIDDMPVFQIKKLSLTDEERMVKRIFDLLFSAAALLVLSPLIALIAIGIKLDSAGPVFYSQERITRDHKAFQLIKFRTMVDGAEGLSGPTLAKNDDARVTRLGRHLRATRLDEIPQFINVLVGDMSIVGPRPERQHFINQFEKAVPEFEYRLSVKAGITGMAQVVGKYNTTFSDKLKYDLFYIMNYSIWFDLELMLKTLKVLFSRSSAQGIKTDLDLDSLLKSKGLMLVCHPSYVEICTESLG